MVILSSTRNGLMAAIVAATAPLFVAGCNNGTDPAPASSAATTATTQAMTEQRDQDRIRELATFRYREGMPFLAQGIEGRLETRDGCAVVTVDNRTVLLVFPDSVSSLSDDGRAIDVAGRTLRLGDNVSLRGEATFDREGQVHGNCTSADTFTVAP